MSAIRPSWSTAPAWARWLAQDGDGSWYWYADRPTASVTGSRVWVRPSSLSKQEKAADDVDSWSKTLEHKK